MSSPLNAAPVYPRPGQLDNAHRSGLVYLRNGVERYFVENGVVATVARVGLKYRSFIVNQSPANANRVAFIPGLFDGSNDPKSRSYGDLSRDTLNSSSVVNPRELLQWARPFTMSVWSAPIPGSKEDEQDVFERAENLVEQTARAVQSVAAATIEWGAVTINRPSAENGFGVEFLIACVQNGPIFDVTLDVAFAKPAVSRGE